MSDVNDIVDITITRESVVPAIDGFGFANFVSASAAFTPKIKAYANITELNADSQAGADAKNFGSLYFGQPIRPKRLYVTKKASDSYLAALQAAQAVNDTWYGVTIASILDADNLAVAAWVNTQMKIFLYKTNDAGTYDADDEYDIFTQMKDLGYDRSFGMYHADAATIQVHGAPLGLQFPKNPGSSNWAYRRLQGLTPSVLNSTQRTNILDKWGNTFTTRNGYNVWENGRMASGEWVDVIQGIDWLQTRMQNNIFAAYVNNEKIPFTDDGIALITTQIEEALSVSIGRNIIAGSPKFFISAPRAADVSKENKAARTLPDIYFEAPLTGAINKTSITGRVLL